MNEEYLRLIGAIYIRPGMYFGKKSYDALINYLYGINIGVYLNGGDLNNDIAKIYEFQEWYQNEYNFETSPKENVIEHIRNLTNYDDELAFDLFFREYIKFLNNIYNIDLTSYDIRRLDLDKNGNMICK